MSTCQYNTSHTKHNVDNTHTHINIYNTHTAYTTWMYNNSKMMNTYGFNEIYMLHNRFTSHIAYCCG